MHRRECSWAVAHQGRFCRTAAVRLGEDFAGICGPETIERFWLLLGGMLTEWVSWAVGDVRERRLRGPALIRALLLAKL
jgi:hypothetical protein